LCKANYVNGAMRGCLGPVACGSIFQNHIGDFIGCFAQSLLASIAFHAELKATMTTIKTTFEKGC